MEPISRREFMTKVLNVGTGLALWPLGNACSDVAGNRSFRKKIVILGIDGLDPSLLEHYIREGVMPNFMRLIGQGGFSHASLIVEERNGDHARLRIVTPKCMG